MLTTRILFADRQKGWKPQRVGLEVYEVKTKYKIVEAQRNLTPFLQLANYGFEKVTALLSKFFDGHRILLKRNQRSILAAN